MNPERPPVKDPHNVYITTNSGIKFKILNPSRDDIDIKDIAHSLSGKNRWNGHADKSFTVGEHSILMAKTAKDLGYPSEIILQCLLHDASEAYMVDMPTPLKILMPNFIEMENRISTAIARKFNYPEKMDNRTHLLDQLSLFEEGLALFNTPLEWVKERKDSLLNGENSLENVKAAGVMGKNFRALLKEDLNRQKIKKRFLNIFDDNF